MSERSRQFVDAMSVPDEVYNRPVPFKYSRTGRHFPLLKLLQEAHDYAGLGRLHEAIATADLMLLHLEAPKGPVAPMEVYGTLIAAAHWYQRAGETESAVLAAKRALFEAGKLLARADLFEGHATIYRWYLTEMMGDAAAVFHRELALSYYRTALAGFAAFDKDDEVGEASDVGFPSTYLYHMCCHFLVDGHRHNWMLAKGRIPPKIREWLES